MGRPLRAFGAGEIYHVTARGSDRRAIFADESDRVAFLSRLRRVLESHALHCLAYCLMDNHYHGLYRTLDARLSDAMRDLHGGYSRLYRTIHGTDAHLFRNRFGAELVDTEAYLLACAAYIDLNPVRAGLVARPELYRWSSHRAVAGYDKRPAFLRPGLVYAVLGGPRSEAPVRYRGFVASRRPALRQSGAAAARP